MKRSKEGAALTELILETFRLNGQLLEAGDRLTAPLELTSARWQVLGAIDYEGRPITVAQIGRRMGLSRQAVQRIINALEAQGFVRFTDNPDHKRAKLVELTPRCVQTIEKLEAVQTLWANALAGDLSEAAIKRTTNLLGKIRTRCAAMEEDNK